MLIALICASVAAALILITLIFTGNFFYRYALSRGGMTVPEDPSGMDRDLGWWQRMGAEEVRIAAADGISLSGRYLGNGQATGRLAILLHGYRGDHREMADYAKIYLSLGFDVFAPDHRSHGASGGKTIGMGYLDKTDCLQWLKYWQKKGGEKTSILIHGVSMGGATVCMLSGEKLPNSVKCLVSDCAYDTIKHQFASVIKKNMPIPPWLILPAGSLFTRIRGGYFLGQGNCVKSVAKSTLPILFLHGGQDDFVPSEMTERLYAAASEGKKRKVIIEGGKHAASVYADPAAYREALADWVQQNMEKGRTE